MEGSIFLLLCLLALFIGTRAKRSRTAIMSEKAILHREKTKKIVMIIALAIISVFLLAYSPFLYQDITIAVQTHFGLNNYLSIAILIVGVFTVLSLLKRLNIIKSSKL